MPQDTVSRLLDAPRAVRALLRSGMMDLRRPVQTARSTRALRFWGPLAGAILIAANRAGQAIGLVDDLGSLTFEQLDHRSNALARALAADGLRAGDVVAVLCRNHRGAVDALLAAAKLGARLLLLNTGFAGPQLHDVLAREKVSLVVYDQEFGGVVASAPRHVRRMIAWVDDPSEWDGVTPVVERLVAFEETAGLPRPARPGSIVLLTSGTTGTPKGAPRSVRSPLAAAQLVDRIPLRRAESTLIAAPLFHGTGFAHLAVALGLRSTVVLTRKFRPEEVLAKAHDNACTAVILVPTMLLRILRLDAEVLRRYDLPNLRVLFCAGAALPPALGNRAQEIFGDVLYNLYGSTEVAVATVATPEDWRVAPGTVGRCPVGCRVRLYDEHGVRRRTPETKGRIFVTNGLRFEGYTDGRSKEVIDGMVSTGDIGHFDSDGRLFVDGRSDDMIVSGGENVFPGEVEDLLAEHAEIAEAAVIGVSDAEYGQRLKAFVVAADGRSPDPERIKEYVKANLARHKVPREVVLVEEIPHNATGKVLRKELDGQA